MAARKINDSMPEYVINRIYEIMKEKQIDSLSKIAIYGLTYKEKIFTYPSRFLSQYSYYITIARGNNLPMLEAKGTDHLASALA